MQRSEPFLSFSSTKIFTEISPINVNDSNHFFPMYGLSHLSQIKMIFALENTFTLLYMQFSDRSIETGLIFLRFPKFPQQGFSEAIETPTISNTTFARAQFCIRNILECPKCTGNLFESEIQKPNCLNAIPGLFVQKGTFCNCNSELYLL